MNTTQDQNSIEQQLLQLTKQERPESVQQLIDLAKNRLSISEKDARKHVLQLINEQKIKLTPQTTPKNLSNYMFSGETSWFWITIILALATVMTVFTVSEDAPPLVYVRYVLGVIFVLWLPGYTFIKALFPTKVPIKTSSQNLDTIERIALSAGMSLTLVPVVGLLLNYTPWGIRLTPVTLSLLALTLVFATVALAREYQENKYKTSPRAR